MITIKKPFSIDTATLKKSIFPEIK